MSGRAVFVKGTINESDFEVMVATLHCAQGRPSWTLSTPSTQHEHGTAGTAVTCSPLRQGSLQMPALLGITTFENRQHGSNEEWIVVRKPNDA